MQAAPTGEGVRDGAEGTGRAGQVQPGLRTCPRCGAPNSPRRLACGRCGMNLASRLPVPSGEALLDEPPGAAEMPPAMTEVVAPRPPVRWKLLLAIVTISALIGSAFGTLVWLRMRSDEPVETPPTFDREVYPESPGVLEVAEVSATSTLAPRGSINYVAELVVDGNPQTAWNEGTEPGRGEGESLTINLAEPAWVARLVIRNGYQKDQATFFDNARAAMLRASFDDGSVYDLVLLDRMGEQAVDLPVPALTRTLVLEVVSAYPGLHYEDLALSEILLSGWVARGEHREAGRGKLTHPRAATSPR